MIRLAQFADEKGYDRYWIAQHHNTKVVLSSATDLLIQHTLAHTKRICAGDNSVMLPNHTSFQVTESYGKLLWASKQEIFYGVKYDSIDELAKEIERYIYRYNNHRIKEKLNGLSPNEYRLQAA